MNKEKLKKGLSISLFIFIGLALAITYFFLLYSNAAISAAFNEVMLVLRPFIIGAVIAYIFKSTCNGYEKVFIKAFSKRKHHDPKKDATSANLISVLLTYITWAIIIGGLLFIVVPQVVASVTDFINNVPKYIETVNGWITDFKVQYPDLAPYVDMAGDYIVNWLNTDLTAQLPEIGTMVLNGAMDAVNLIKDIVIGLVISVFILAGRKAFARKSKLLVKTIFKEKHANAIINETRFADRMFGGFLEGKIIDSTIVGIIYFIALVLLDINYAALLALICGVTNIIPFFGPFIGAIPSGFIILMTNEVDPIPKLIYFIIFVCIAQFIDGYFVDPHIVGGNIKMSPFGVIFAVLLFGGLWGFGGLLIGVPTFAVIYDIFRKIVFGHLKKTGKKTVLLEYLEDSGRIKKKPKPAEATAPEAVESPATESVQDTTEK